MSDKADLSKIPPFKLRCTACDIEFENDPPGQFDAHVQQVHPETWQHWVDTGEVKPSGRLRMGDWDRDDDEEDEDE